MDFSKFLSEEFDHKQWINDAFKACDANLPVDRRQLQSVGNIPSIERQHASNLVMKLQVYMQEVNTKIDENCQQAVQSIPRVMREIESVRQEASLLQEQMRSVKTEIEKVEKDTSASMSTLVTIDTLRSRLHGAERALREADSWTTLSEDLEEVLASGDIDKIAEKIVGLQQSLRMLVSVPDYGARVRRVEELKNQLESLISPRAIQAFGSQDTASAARLVRTLESVERGEQAEKYYQAWLKGHVRDCWRTCTAVEGDQPKEVLASFYDKIHSLWRREMTSSVFEDTVTVISNSLAQSLRSISDLTDTFFVDVIREVIDPQDKLLRYASMLKATDMFVAVLEASIIERGSGYLTSEESWRLARSIYLPYKGMLVFYSKAEKQFLDAKFNEIPLDHAEVGETIDLLEVSVKKVFNFADEAVTHCSAVTHGVGYSHLFDLLREYLESYVKEFGRVGTNIREKCSSTEWDQVDELAFLQNGLLLTIVTGLLSLKCEAFIQRAITTTSSYLKKCASNKTRFGIESPFHAYPTLLLDEGDNQSTSLHDLVQTLHDGGSPTALASVRSWVHRLCEETHSKVFDIVIGPALNLLEPLPSLDVWSGSSGSGEELPSFAYSPQEYITKIGQFFLTLPQQLEPFLANDNPGLIEALRRGHIPFAPPVGSKTGQSDTTLVPMGAEIWLECLARGVMHHLVETVLRIQELSNHGAKQLVADIEYLSNVVEDLDLTPLDNLLQLRDLISAPKDAFSEISSGKPKRIVNIVRSMRNL